MTEVEIFESGLLRGFPKDVKVVSDIIIDVIKHRDDIKARAKISFASMIVGYNLVYSSTSIGTDEEDQSESLSAFFSSISTSFEI